MSAGDSLRRSARLFSKAVIIKKSPAPSTSTSQKKKKTVPQDVGVSNSSPILLKDVASVESSPSNISEIKRCHWFDSIGDSTQLSLIAKLHRDYHDTEWGTPTPNLSDNYIFEMITLASAQAGLSWSTILQKRDAYRIQYNNFDVKQISEFDERKIDEMLGDGTGIIRNRAKVMASISNAVNFLKVSDEFGGFCNYIGTFMPKELPAGRKGFELTLTNGSKVYSLAKVTHMTETEFSQNLAKDMKKRGFKFFGPVIAYAFLQTIGFVHDHDSFCFRYYENV
ncbi:hypothetical protein HK098_001535 [Nowakowskiella sp. JEL0407]|nr:hypothetical protein HK098_001535 [Nowakowskiella sp. JEL0407]